MSIKSFKLHTRINIKVGRELSSWALREYAKAKGVPCYSGSSQESALGYEFLIWDGFQVQYGDDNVYGETISHADWIKYCDNYQKAEDERKRLASVEGQKERMLEKFDDVITALTHATTLRSLDPVEIGRASRASSLEKFILSGE